MHTVAEIAGTAAVAATRSGLEPTTALARIWIVAFDGRAIVLKMTCVDGHDEMVFTVGWKHAPFQNFCTLTNPFVNLSKSVNQTVSSRPPPTLTQGGVVVYYFSCL